MEERSERPHWGALLLAAAVLLAAGAALLLPWRQTDATLSVRTSGAAVLDLSRNAAAQTAMGSAASPGGSVIPLGRTVGIKLFSDGVLVVGLSEIQTQNGAVSPARSMGLKAGDVITHINDREVDTIEQVQALLQTLAGQTMTLRVDRDGKQLQLSGSAILSDQGAWQLGAWIRDSMAGIGTMTFYDPSSDIFAALGHGINDIDTAQLMPLQSGSIMYSTVTDVKKGLSGAPGELHGTFDLDRDMGELYANTEAGIFGTLTDDSILGEAEAVPIAGRSEIRTGPATILSNIAGDEVVEYQVEITHVYPAADGETRDLMLQVTDPVLLEKTGGIVQGMSGSPILQGGKLVGAVTHVLVNDPTRGYGILASSMLDRATWQEHALVS